MRLFRFRALPALLQSCKPARALRLSRWQRMKAHNPPSKVLSSPCNPAACRMIRPWPGLQVQNPDALECAFCAHAARTVPGTAAFPWPCSPASPPSRFLHRSHFRKRLFSIVVTDPSPSRATVPLMREKSSTASALWPSPFCLSRAFASEHTALSSLSCEKYPPLTPLRPRFFCPVAGPRTRTNAPRAFLSRKIIPSTCARAAFVLSRAFAHGRTALVSLVREISLVVRALRGGRHAVQSALLRPAWEAPENEKMKTASGAAHMRPMPSRKRCFRPQ